MVCRPLMTLLSVVLVGTFWLRTHAVALLSHSLRITNASTRSSICTPLRNRGSHFTVEIQVGTPSQKLDVIADTGSDAVIVSSCACRARQRCFPHSKCFTGKSSSFLVPHPEHPSTVVLTFGSGQIKAAPSTDVVHVGSAWATMNESLLLMVDHRLNIEGPFEGILGLGLPKSKPSSEEQAEQEQHFPGFLQMANVGRFSICVNHEADGVLRLGSPPGNNALGSIGQEHWGLDFRGISAGTQQSSSFCTLESMSTEQVSPCGAIPDSGTTLIMGPGVQLMELFSSLCDSWPRCLRAARQSSSERYETFLSVLSECEQWLSSEEGLNEMPAIHLHVAGSAGNTETLDIPAAAYVLTVAQEDGQFLSTDAVHSFAAHTLSLKKSQHVCIPAFGEFDFPTRANGPAWILGLPLFYAYQVGYDLSAQPPAVTFSTETCGTCEENGTMLLSPSRQHSRILQPERLRAPPRKPTVGVPGSPGSSRTFSF
eukprot:TRINITY_DN14373_c0_g2_i1.p1 TRINITY_DN14373_c0_g2~~TRINITY_DN14373_c0_g2_i1.p1  ORF type:complete len:483 (-),score=38.42 TRINITY_DN14373_c0_g2_i1:103-1551(-)